MKVFFVTFLLLVKFSDIAYSVPLTSITKEFLDDQSQLKIYRQGVSDEMQWPPRKYSSSSHGEMKISQQRELSELMRLLRINEVRFMATALASQKSELQGEKLLSEMKDVNHTQLEDRVKTCFSSVIHKFADEVKLGILTDDADLSNKFINYILHFGHEKGQLSLKHAISFILSLIPKYFISGDRVMIQFELTSQLVKDFLKIYKDLIVPKYEDHKDNVIILCSLKYLISATDNAIDENSLNCILRYVLQNSIVANNSNLKNLIISTAKLFTGKLNMDDEKNLTESFIRVIFTVFNILLPDSLPKLDINKIIMLAREGSRNANGRNNLFKLLRPFLRLFVPDRTIEDGLLSPKCVFDLLREFYNGAFLQTAAN